MKPKTVGRDRGIDSVPPPQNFSGLMATSIIMTQNGEAQVQNIKAGDRIITRDCGMAVVKSVRSRCVATRAVHIKAGSFGHTRPNRDATLPWGQLVLIRDWRAQAIFCAKQAMVEAHRLIDGEFITRRDHITMTLYELEFDRPHVLYVDGLEVAGHLASAVQAKAA